MKHAFLIIMNNYAIITNRRLSLLHAETPRNLYAHAIIRRSREGPRGGARGTRGVKVVILLIQPSGLSH